MSSLYDVLYGLFHGNGAVAFAAVFVWGIMGMVLSPCSVSTIPLVVGYVSSSDDPGIWTAFRLSMAFSVGVFVNLLFLGGLLTSAGVFLGGIDRYTNYIVAAAFVLFGLHLMGIINLPWFRGGSGPSTKRKGVKGALVLGTLSGLALGPCSFAYSAPVILLTIKTAATDLTRALLMLLFYGLGQSAVLVAAGTAADVFSRLFSLGSPGRTSWMSRICGVVLLAAALYLIRNSAVI
ncbi:MAG TPA: cytochrome C biogenesis protein [Synergistaceae bacterium]|jgi:cytochrome c-type biogenesis protein|nr:cytochrome C biogenesis protein [Synergistaceae bacterium]